ncbi:EAL domain-containing protein [Pleionea sp. CnH1-48]|uniref:EAL domain-containing protein n=1 Tax=Pleionea sp. CnH1-48 TaxID=2954494 RepID=UPI002097AD6A|nr:EAL domain-containing protein [Pleionea sp. CnH1-48]MCO7224803.1 EAL domain-containing protein [Pleionea sp. CnH1-48]
MTLPRLLLIIFLLPIQLILANDLLLKQLPKNSNIPSEFVSHIEPLSNGYILFSTNAGARLFDGYRFIPVLSTEDDIFNPLNSYVYFTYEDSRGTLWFATALGLYKIVKGDFQLIKVSHDPKNNNSLLNDNVRFITEDSQGSIWFATLSGVSRYTPDTNSFKHFTQPVNIEEEININKINVILEDNHQRIWVGTIAGLYYIDLNNLELNLVKGITEEKYFTSGFVSKSGEVWLGADSGGIYRVDAQTRKIVFENKETSKIALKSNNIWALFQDDSELIWIGYWSQGVSVFDPKTKMTRQLSSQPDDPNSLPGNSIEEIAADHSGLIWIATTGGAAWFNPETLLITTLTHSKTNEKSINDSNIWSIHQSPDGTVWLGTEDGLEQWKPDTNTITHYYHQPGDDTSVTAGTIWNIKQIDEKHLLLATDKGVDILDIESKAVRHIRNLKSSEGKSLSVAFYSMAQASSNKIYVASNASTIHLLEPHTEEAELIFDARAHAETRESEYFNSILPSQDGALWLGSTTGLYRYDLTKKTIITYSTNNLDNRLSGNVIYSLLEDKSGDIWVATAAGGINKIRVDKNHRSQITFYDRSKGLPSNTVTNLLMGPEPYLYFTTNSHFGRLDKHTGEIKVYNNLNSQAEAYSPGAALYGNNDYVYLGGSQMRTFKPEALKESDYIPPIKITGIQSVFKAVKDFKALASTHRLELYPEDTLVTISFASLDYAFPEKNRFRYQLRGVDKEWLTPGTENHATYTHLPSGRFSFVVQGTNRDGKWSENKATIDVRVYPPIWRSGYAYTLYIALILTALWMYLRAVKEKKENERKSVEAIKLSESRLRDVLWGSGDELWRWDLKSNKVWRTNNVNHGDTANESVISYKQLFSRIHPEDQDLVKATVEAYLKGKEQYCEAQYRILSKEYNAWRWVLSKGRIVERDANNAPQIIAGTTKDISELKQTEDQLRCMANYDQLTRLPNRTMFLEHLKHAINLANRYDEKVALLFLDLDGFKLINDSMGHGVGDQLLQAVALRLKKCLRGTDNVARLGGDEFTVIIERVSKKDNVVPQVERVIEDLSRPFHLINQTAITSTSIGVAFYPDDGDTPANLLKHADIAMYEAKRLGKKNYRFFQPEMNALLVKRLDMEKALEKALKNSEFKTYYQPRVCVNSNKILGFEALIRWFSPEKGMVSPADFIPVAEETGQILEIGNWVLNDVCQQASIWHQQGWSGTISVNIAALQFKQSDLTSDVKAVLKKYQLPGDQLELEITEGTLIENLELTRSLLIRLKNLGVRIALDDFGTGYSSLAYLQQFPIDLLKIDRSFITQLEHSSKAAKLSQAIINMAHSLDLRVVAEGIEDNYQLDFLRSSLCEEYQGYLFGKPLPAEEVEELYLGNKNKISNGSH